MALLRAPLTDPIVQPGMARMFIREAWALVNDEVAARVGPKLGGDVWRGAPDVRYAIVELAGFRLPHEDLPYVPPDRTWRPFTTATGTTDVSEIANAPMPGHGTGIFGCVAAQHNGIGCVGIAPDSTPILIAGSGAVNMEAAFQKAITLGAKSIGCSFGNYATSDPNVSYMVNLAINTYQCAIFAAVSDSIINVDGLSDYPTRYAGVISVSQIDNNDIAYGGYGATVNFVAPSAWMTTDLMDPSGYRIVGGSSTSTPLLVGIDQLLLAVNPALTVARRKSILLETGQAVAGVTATCPNARLPHAALAVLRAHTTLAKNANVALPWVRPFGARVTDDGARYIVRPGAKLDVGGMSYAPASETDPVTAIQVRAGATVLYQGSPGSGVALTNVEQAVEGSPLTVTATTAGGKTGSRTLDDVTVLPYLALTIIPDFASVVPGSVLLSGARSAGPVTLSGPGAQGELVLDGGSGGSGEWRCVVSGVSGPAAFTIAGVGERRTVTAAPPRIDVTPNLEEGVIRLAGNRFGSSLSLSTGSVPDTSKPRVVKFSPGAFASNVLPIPAGSFVAVDRAGVAGYAITKTSKPPSASDLTKWSAQPPASWAPTAGMGVYAFPWAKDAAGNVSPVFPAPISLGLVDTGQQVPFRGESPAGFTANPPSARQAGDLLLVVQQPVSLAGWSSFGVGAAQVWYRFADGSEGPTALVSPGAMYAFYGCTGIAGTAGGVETGSADIGWELAASLDTEGTFVVAIASATTWKSDEYARGAGVNFYSPGGAGLAGLSVSRVAANAYPVVKSYDVAGWYGMGGVFNLRMPLEHLIDYGEEDYRDDGTNAASVVIVSFQ